MTGQRLADRYEIQEEIGRGATAIVYRARDIALGNLVAIKRLAPHLAQDPEAVGRLRTEMLATRPIVSEAVARVYEFIEEGDQAFIVMEFGPAGTLRDHLLVHGPLNPQQLDGVMEQMAGALVACHEKGVLHRDLKPSNALFDPATGRIKLIDFGVAQVSDALDGDTIGSVVGTPEYMAPEQFGDVVPDPRSDLYSAGVLLYEAATGRRPITGRSLPQVIRAHQEGLYPRPREVAPKLGEGAEMVILRLMAKDPAHRFQTADEFSAFLGARSLKVPAEAPRSSPSCPGCSSPRETGLPFCPMCGISLDGFDRFGRWAVRVPIETSPDKLGAALTRLFPECVLRRPNRAKSPVVLDFASEALARWLARELRREGIAAAALGPATALGSRDGKGPLFRFMASSLLGLLVAITAGLLPALAVFFLFGLVVRFGVAGAIVSPLPLSVRGSAPLARARSSQARIRGARYKSIGCGLIVSAHRMGALRSAKTEQNLAGADSLLEASFDLLEAMDLQAQSLFMLKESSAARHHRKSLILRGSHVLLRLTTLWRSRVRDLVRGEAVALARGLNRMDQTQASLKEERERIRSVLSEMKTLGSPRTMTRSAGTS